MCRALISLVVMFGAASAFAQTQPQQYEPAPQQLSGNFYVEPHYAPQSAPAVVPAPQPAQQPAHTPQAQPWDYGQSVRTDIRQMNF